MLGDYLLRQLLNQIMTFPVSIAKNDPQVEIKAFCPWQSKSFRRNTNFDRIRRMISNPTQLAYPRYLHYFTFLTMKWNRFFSFLVSNSDCPVWSDQRIISKSAVISSDTRCTVLPIVIFSKSSSSFASVAAHSTPI